MGKYILHTKEKKPVYGTKVHILIFLGFFLLFSADAPGQTEAGQLFSMESIYVKQFQFAGNTVFPDETLAFLVSGYTGKSITPEELHDAVDIISLHYYNSGYANSGALIPNQSVENGIIRIEIVEGRLDRIDITGNTRLREGYIRRRMVSLKDKKNIPLNITRVRNRLKMLRQDPRIQNINARLTPGIEPGIAVLEVEVKEEKPFHIDISADNHRPPAIGSYQGTLALSHINLSGLGDTLAAEYSLTEGLDAWDISYSIPVTRWDTIVGAGMERSESVVVSDSFAELDIRSETTRYFCFLNHPVYKTLETELTLGLKLEKHENNTYLLGEPFSFSKGVYQGESENTVLRFSQQWVQRSMNQVIALYSSFNFGIEDDETDNQAFETYQEFESWLGQAQYIRRPELFDSTMLLSAKIQYADDPLLPSEKFALGGNSSVRGYRENRITSDTGVNISFEWRIPVFQIQLPGVSKRTGDGNVEIVPFFDYGWADNAVSDPPDPNELYSTGLGIRWIPAENWLIGVYWGKALKSVEEAGDSDIQDDGFHFRVSARLF